MELEIIKPNYDLPAENDNLSFAGMKQPFLELPNVVNNNLNITSNLNLTSSNQIHTLPTIKNTTPFITANSEDITLSILKEKCVIPVFTKDNEITISHSDFIETSISATKKCFLMKLLMSLKLE